MISLGPDEMAKYPFLADAGQYLRDKGFTLEQLGGDPDLRMILDRAMHRIEVAADGKIYRSDLASDRASKGSVLPLEVFSFLLAAVLLRMCGAATLIRRFALAEARRAERYLEQDLADLSDASREQLAVRIIAELFSVTVTKRDGFFTIPARDYLTHSVHFHEREWKLVNRRVEEGLVFLSPHETVRLIRRELGEYIGTKIRSSATPPMTAGFEAPVARLTALAKRFQTAVVQTTEYPPCIKHAIAVLEKGENLPHSGRFMLATFLLARGQTPDQIAPLFTNAPDYNERITRYQLNHLSGGEPGGEPRYSCPSCDKLRDQSLCFEAPACDGVINPMQFGRGRGGGGGR